MQGWIVCLNKTAIYKNNPSGRAVNVPGLQILRIDSKGKIKGRHNAWYMMSFVQKILDDSDRHNFEMTVNARKPIRLLYYSGIPQLMRKHSM